MKETSTVKQGKRKSQHSEEISRLAGIVSSDIALNDVFPSFARELKALVDFNHLSIGSIEGERVRFLAASSEMSTEVGPDTIYPLRDSAASWVRAHQTTNIEKDFTKEKQFPIDDLYLKSGLRSAIRVPLFSRGEVFGTLNLTSSKPNAYGEGEKEILEQLAGQIASAIWNARYTRALRIHQQLIITISNLMKRVGAGLSWEEAYNSFAADLKELLPFDEASIHLVDPTQQRFKVWAISSTTETATRPGELMPLKGSGTEWVTSRNESHIEADISQERHFATDENLARQGYRAILRVPLGLGGQPFGSFNLRSHLPGVYGETERQTAEYLSTVFALTVWYEHLSKLEKEQRRELEEQDRLRKWFIRFLAHELRTPLTPVLASAQMLDQQLPREAESAEDRLIQNIITGAQAMDARLTELLDLAQSQPTGFALEVSPIDAKALLEEVVSQFQPIAKNKEQSLALEVPESLPRVRGDRQRLSQVLTNLLGNATKFTPKGGSIVLRATPREREVLIEVQDNGHGIPPREQKRLFQLYYRGRGGRRTPGTGLGLALSRQLVEAHEGEIWVKSKPGKGSTFSFTVPLSNRT